MHLSAESFIYQRESQLKAAFPGYLEALAAAALCSQADGLLTALMAGQPIQTIVNPLPIGVISIHKESPALELHLRKSL